MFLESKPQNNPYRIKVKPTPTDQALLTTLQTVPGLGQRKAMALLAKFNSKKMNNVILKTIILKGFRARKNFEFQLVLWESSCLILLAQGNFLFILVNPRLTNMNFLLTISIHYQEKRSGELTK